ncbi:MAG TPA: sugar phosphate isomerase/epimerase family protein [Bryobacteraceae bacterium]|nr:sugar phosphate isomerase/epimerase family protein [Bryobacteraceae bacterium]
MTRREFAKWTAAAPLAAAAKGFARIESKIDGVMIGAQTYSFRDLPMDACIDGMKDIGLGYAELWIDKIQPSNREQLQAWRSNPPMDEIRAVRKKFEDAGVEIYAVNISFRDDFTDQQIEKGFEIAKALGTNRITASSNVDISPRVDKYAQQYKIYVGFHNHDSMRPNEFSTPDDWKRALEGRSKYIGINLDIGHFTAANFNPLSFLEEHHSQIITLHLKDRKKNHGPNMPWGQGETNIQGVLQLLKTKKYPIPAMIEYEYDKPGLDTITEVRKCFNYCKQALAD